LTQKDEGSLCSQASGGVARLTGPAADPIGTVRRTPDGRVWIAGATHEDDRMNWRWDGILDDSACGDDLMVDSVVVGAVPGTPAAAVVTSPDELRERVEKALQEWFHGVGYTAPGHNEISDDCCWCGESAEQAMEVVTPELERRDAEIRKLKEKRAGDEQAIRALMAGKEEIAAELGWSEAPASGLMAARCGRLRIEREEAQQQVRTLAWLHAEAVWRRGQLESDHRIRQGALNDVLGRDRAQNSPTDYYNAIEDVADLKRALALAEERIAKTRQALRLDDKWSVQHGALAVRSERDRAVAQLAATREFVSWLAAMDQDTEARRRVTLGEITARAAALTNESSISPPVSESVPATPAYPADLFERADGRYVCVCGELVGQRQEHLVQGYKWGCIDPRSPSQPDPSRDSATSEASTLTNESFISQQDDDSSSTPPAAGEADTTPRVWNRGDDEPADYPWVRDCHGDVWTHVPGTFEWTTPETQNCAWSYIARKFFPLVEVLPNTEQEAEK
jgi:hypothetical protein